MKLFSRARHAIQGPPEGAHGRRNIDGSYWSVWMAPCGHGEVGEVDRPPGRDTCRRCMWDHLLNRTEKDTAPVEWRRATRKEAEDFIFDLEGFKAYDGIGFKLL